MRIVTKEKRFSTWFEKVRSFKPICSSLFIKVKDSKHNNKHNKENIFLLLSRSYYSNTTKYTTVHANLN